MEKAMSARALQSGAGHQTSARTTSPSTRWRSRSSSTSTSVIASALQSIEAPSARCTSRRSSDSARATSGAPPSNRSRSSAPVGSSTQTSIPETGRRTLATLGLLLVRLADRGIPLPSLVFQLDVLEGDRVAAGVEVRQGLVLGDPASVDDVLLHGLAGFVLQDDAHGPPQVGERRRGGALVQLLRRVGPVLEVQIVGDAALERDRLVLRPADTLQNDRVAAFAVVDHIGAALHARDLADPGHGIDRVAEEDEEAVALVRVEAIDIHRKRLPHKSSY